MKAFITSLSIFAVVLAGQFWFYHSVTMVTDSLTAKTKIVAEFVDDEDWANAETAAENLKQELEVHKTFLMSMIAHFETDQIEIAIGNVEAYIQNEDKSQAVAGLNELTFLFKHIAATEALTFENLL